MQKSISKVAVTWRLLLSLLIVSTIVACEDTNTVGSELIDPISVSIDTIFVNDFIKQTETPFSGNIGQLPVGTYDDQVFGTFQSIGYLKPELVEKTAPLNLESVFRLVLHVNKELTYGDTTQSLDVNIYQIDELWRSSNIKYTDELTLNESDLIGTFTYQDQDSLEVELSDSLLIDYLRYYDSTDSLRDSLYNFNFQGFALVPENNSSKIIYPDFDASRIYSIRRSNGDTISIPLQTSGFNLTNQGGQNTTDRINLNSNLDNFYKLNLKDLSSVIGNKNLLEAEFILYEDFRTLNESANLPQGHVRQTPNFLDMKSLDANQRAYQLQFQGSDFIAARDSLNSSFNFNITNHLNDYIFNDRASQDLYLNINPSGGRILSTILFDSSATDDLRPKIVLKIAE